jgi:acetyltransferase-like isoleucine patch superfamily enzyme
MYKIGKNSKIKANHIDIHKSVEIGDNVQIHCDSIKIDKFSKIGNDVKISCRNLEVGEFLYMADGVEIGRGGSTGLNSNVKIGKHVGIFERTIINPSESVEIGDDVGIGAEVMIWTHGAWLDVTQGFPSDFGPVKIGNNVWLPARSIVLPNVIIGDNSVIGIGSIVNKSLPNGCLAAGSPCRVLKENQYPKELTNKEKEKLINGILDDWLKLLDEKKVYYHYTVEYKNNNIYLREIVEGACCETIFNLNERTISNGSGEVVEDLRDYLRRRGIKFYTNKPFKSIKQEWTK